MEFITISITKKIDLKFLIFVFFTLILNCRIFSQTPVHATVITSQSNVDFSANASDSNLATKAQIRASTGIAIGIGAYSGSLELEFPTTLPANTTSYVKIDADDNLLPVLLGGSLGGLLSDVLGVVLIGNQEFDVEARNGATTVLEGHSQIPNSFASNNLRIVVNAQNDYFIALTPALPYNRIRLTNRVGALLGLNNVKRLGVYGAFYVDPADTCGTASYTSYDGNGLNLDLIGLGGAGVTNPHHVIDSNPNNFSRLSLGILAVAASIKQTVYFDGLSQTSDQFHIRLKVDPSLLALGVANNIQITASNNGTVVQSVNLNSLLNLDLLTLLQGNQIATIPFSPNAPANKIAVQYTSLLNVQLTQSLDLYDIKRVPPRPTITDAFTLNPIVCSGATASLVAQSISGTQINWYSQAVGGAVLATTNSGQPFVTGPLTANVTYYIAAHRIGCPEESLRVRIDVTVTPLPVASDITIASPVDACNGVVVLSPSSTIGGATFRYYKNQSKTIEITTGYAGDAGVTYVINNTTGQLTITGLTLVNSPYTYYISLTANGCENAVNTLKPIVINFSSGLVLNVAPTLQGCGSVDLSDAIINFNTSGDIQYTFFNSGMTVISAQTAANITSGGTYFIQSSSVLGGCSSTVQQVIVTINPQATLTIPNPNVTVNIGASVTLVATSNSPITWYDANGNILTSTVVGPFATAGLYTFTAVANNGSCTVIGSIYVTVLDPLNCPALSQRVYADTQSWGSIVTGGVVNANNAIDDNPKTFSTIITGIGLLGTGTTWQTLQWNTTILAGTPLNLKLGSQYSGLILAGAYSVVATKRNGSGVPVDIGFPQPVAGTLLNVLPGENSFEFTFVPSNSTGPKAYDGVRIIVGSIASVAQNVKVYEVYYDAGVTQMDCALGDVEDVFSGAIDLGVGVATTTVGVDDPYDAVDASLTSYASLYSGAGILAAADLTVSFTTPTLAGESIQIRVSKPGTLLSVSLMTGLSIQTYMGNSAVGPVLINTSTSLSLELLNAGDEALLTIAPLPWMYDRIKIRLGGVTSVLDVLRINDINRVANTHVTGANATNTIEACRGTVIQLEMTPQNCVTYLWYDAAVGGNVVSTGTSFTIPATLPAGTYDFYIQPVRYGCALFDRGKVTVIVGQTAPPTAITQVQVNGGNVTNLCSTTGNVTLTAVLNSTLTLTNPLFYWYSFNGTSQQLIAGQSTATLVLSSLAPGTYTYYVGISSDEFCETAQPDRAQITFTILPFSQSSDITANSQSLCTNDIAIITPTSSLANPQFFWFFANDNLQPIANGSTVGGVTFNIAPNGSITVSGLTTGSYTYYVGLTSNTSCLNQTGNFKPVVITINNGTTPTTNATTQTFCQDSNPTIASIQVNEANVTWYSTPTLGTPLAATTPLVNGSIYYGSLTNGFNCPSTIRLEVAVAISTGTTPTTNSASQTFCHNTNATVASIQVNELNVIWYLTPSLGTPLASTTPLVNGGIYYGSLTNGFGCVSPVRLQVTITISNGTTPTTNAASQTFCQSANPTIASIQVNEPNVTWFSTPTLGTPLATTTPLVNGGIYYASIIDAFGCVSAIRLVVTISISNGATPTTNATSQTFCLSNNPTVANIQVNEANVSWYTTPTQGTPLSLTTPLVNGATYYASLGSGSGCESPIRLQVTVSISSGTTPTTNTATQTFCPNTNPTIANIQVNELNVNWYLTPTLGTPLAATTPLISGTVYYASVTDGSGCQSGIRLEITVSLTIDAIAVITASNAAPCALDQVTYTTNPGMSNYVWTVTNGTVVSGGQSTDNAVIVLWTGSGPSSVSVNFNNSCAVPASTIFNVDVVVCSDLGITKTVDNPTPIVETNVTFTITVTNNGSSQMTNIVVSEILPSGYTYVSSATSTGMYNTLTGNWNIPLIAANQSATLLITVKVLSTGNYWNSAAILGSTPIDNPVNNFAGVATYPLCLTVYNEFSPNDDGANDWFNIDCIQNFPNNKLEVFNRYGVLVYSKNHYTNDWNGTANVSGTVNKDDKLPSGTYYYVLDIGVDGVKKNGWLSIVR